MRILRVIWGVIKVLVMRIYRYVNPIGYARHIGVKVGQGCCLNCVNFGSEPYLVTLGDRVAIAEASFITHDGGVWVFREKIKHADVMSPIRVGSNVLIGYRAIIMPGVTIGDNVVIGAGSVVTRDIPSNCVAVGTPAKPIKTLEEYYDSLKDNILVIRNLSPKEKKNFLLKHFDINNLQVDGMADIEDCKQGE